MKIDTAIRGRRSAWFQAEMVAAMFVLAVSTAVPVLAADPPAASSAKTVSKSAAAKSGAIKSATAKPAAVKPGMAQAKPAVKKPAAKAARTPAPAKPQPATRTAAAPPVVSTATAPAAAAAPVVGGVPRTLGGDGPSRFVSDFAQRTMGAMGTGASEARRVQLEALMRDSFDFHSVGQHVLGRHWNRASRAEQSEFQSIFADFSVRNYAKRIADLEITSIKVLSSRNADRDTLVETAIDRTGKPTAMFAWRVRDAGGRPRVVDVIVDGVSMADTQRDEMSSLINRGGIEAAIARMRQMTAAL